MSTIAARRCFNHARREAVARCLVCGNFFCRECIAEHGGRMICARCLLPADVARSKRRLLFWSVRLLQLLTGLMLLWLVFFMAGKALLTLPSSFHEGTLWVPGKSDQ